MIDYNTIIEYWVLLSITEYWILFYILFFIRRDHIFCTVYSMLDTGNGGRRGGGRWVQDLER
jgi:hypothetical protein